MRIELKNWQSIGCNFVGFDYFSLLNLDSHERALRLGLNSELRTKDDWLNLFWTFHEKLVIVDSEIFLGSTDIANGRWDSSQHEVENKEREERLLYLDLDVAFTAFPWHDIQLRIEDSEKMRNALVKKYFGAKGNEELEEDCGRESSKAEEMGGTQGNGEEKILRDNLEGKTEAELPLSPQESHSHEDFCELITTDEENEEIYERLLENIRDPDTDFVYMENQMISSFPFGENRLLHFLLERVKRELLKGKLFRVMILTNLYFGDSIVTYGSLRSLFFGGDSFAEKLSEFLKENSLSWEVDDILNVFFLAKSEKNKIRTIYVHGKAFFFGNDDLVLGSSNLNDRSLLKDRDVELNVHVKSERVEKFLKELIGEHLQRSPEELSGKMEEIHEEMVRISKKNLELMKTEYGVDPEMFAEDYFSGEEFERGWESPKDQKEWRQLDGHLVWFPKEAWKLVRKDKMLRFSGRIPFLSSVFK